MACKWQAGANGALIDTSNGRVVGFSDKQGNELLFPYILAQSAVPIILLPAGTWNNTTGDLSLGTSLPYQPTGTVLVFLFASGIGQAGLYQATFSSVNRLQLVGNPATVAGAYTPLLATNAPLLSVTVPGGSVGANGAIRYDFIGSNSPSANNKQLMVYLGAQYFAGLGMTTTQANRANGSIRNRGVQNQQLNSGSSIQLGITNSGTAPAVSAVDTSTDKQFTIYGTISVSTAEFVILDAYTVEVLPGA